MALALHDVADAEQFAGAIVARSGLELSYHDREDLREFFLVEAWKLSLRYEAGGLSPRFGVYAGAILRRRVVDWQRKRFGRRR